MDNEQINILLIEDNPGDARLVREMLVETGTKRFNLEQVERISEGVTRLGQDNFHVILLDLSLPDGHGLDTLTRVCTVAPHVPVLVLTGLDDEYLAIKAVQEGAQDYLIKGQMNSNLLVRALRYAIERKQAEEALRESEETARALVNATNDSVFLIDTSGTVLALNEITAKRLGKTVDEMVGSHLYDSLPPEVAKRRKAYLDQAFRTGKAVYFEDERQGIWFDTCAYPILDAKGKVARLAIYGRDITERKHAEEAIRQSEERFRQLFDEAPVGYFESDSQGRITNVNRTELEMLGYTPEEMIGQPLWKFVVEEEVARNNILARLAGTLPPARAIERTYRRKDGATFPVLIENRVLKDSEGKIIGMRSTIQDITEHKRAEKALLESEEGYRTAIENSNDGVAIDKDGLHLFVNKKFLELFGYNYPEEVIGKHLVLTVHPDDKDRVKEINLKRQRGEDVPSRYEFKGIRKDGEIIYIEVSATKTTYHGETVSLAYLRDITERKKAEQEIAALQEQFRQSQKMEAIGQLAGGIAHDFNNILTIIKGYSQLSLSELKKKDPLRENIEEIQKASERAANLTHQLLAFSRRQIMDVKVLDVNTILRDLDKMLHRIIGEDIELIRLLAEDLGRVKTNPGQIEQVIMNLAVNARDAMPKGGKLTIETANVELDGKYALKHIAVKPGHYVMLSMSDTGMGMKPEVKERIFEPFFTTKEKGKGTGLGLSTVYGIVKQIGGNIWVYSEPGHGTTFKIYLPRVDEPPEAWKENEVKEEIPGGRETVLIVEDDESVRKMALLVLEKKGYTVLEAKDGNEALLLCKARKEPIHLILTDVVMPGISGRQLVDQLKEVHQDIKSLYMSGYTDNAIVHHGVLRKGMNFIQKPFTIDELMNKVRKVLDK